MDKVIKYIPLLTPLIIFSGFLKLHYYYSLWNINIADFLNVAEILTSFLDDIILLSFIFFLIILHVVFVGRAYRGYLGWLKRKQSIKAVKEAISSANQASFKLLLISSIFCSITLVGYFYWWSGFIYLFILFSAQVFFVVFSLLRRSRNLSKNNSELWIYLIFLFFALPYMTARKEYNLVHSGNFQQYTFQTNDKEIILKKNDYFIGKTEDFYFFDIDNKLKIVASTSIKEITIPNRF